MSVDPAWAFSSIAELGQRLRARACTAVELATFFVDRLEKLGPPLGAVVTVTENAEELTVGADKYGRVLAMRAGDVVNVERSLGTGPDAFEIVRNADVEWFFAGKEGPTLNQKFDDGIVAIMDAVAAAPTLGGSAVRYVMPCLNVSNGWTWMPRPE